MSTEEVGEEDLDLLCSMFRHKIDKTGAVLGPNCEDQTWFKKFGHATWDAVARLEALELVTTCPFPAEEYAPLGVEGTRHNPPKGLMKITITPTGQVIAAAAVKSKQNGEAS
jgi:hypothetical protein